MDILRVLSTSVFSKKHSQTTQALMTRSFEYLYTMQYILILLGIHTKFYSICVQSIIGMTLKID